MKALNESCKHTKAKGEGPIFLRVRLEIKYTHWECPIKHSYGTKFEILQSANPFQDVYKRQELHGSVLRNYCMRCRKPYDVRDIAAGKGVPKCTCGGTIKPDVVLYEESLDSVTTVSYTHL